MKKDTLAKSTWSNKNSNVSTSTNTKKKKSLEFKTACAQIMDNGIN